MKTLKFKFDSQVIPHFAWEALLLRLGFAIVVFLSLPAWMPFSSQPNPNGLAHFVELGFLGNPGVWGPLRAVSLVALVFYVIGVATLPALTWLLAIMLASGSLQNSQGAIGHSFQPIVLMILAQWLLGIVLVFTRPGGARRFWIDDLRTQQLLLHAAKVAFVVCYVTSAVTKLENSGGKWIWMTPNLAVQMVKTQHDQYYSTGEKPGAFAEALPGWMGEHPGWTRAVIGPALILELLAFLALIGRGPALAMGLALIAMHVGIGFLMQLHFWLWEWLLLIFFVNPPYWLWKAWPRPASPGREPNTGG